MGTLVLTISVIACLSIRSAASGSASSSHRHNVCTTKECYDLSQMIKNSANMKVNPCDDFYEYVCGNWTGIPVPYGVAPWAQLEEGRTIMRTEVAKYLHTKVTDKDSYPVQWAKTHFQACMNKRELDLLGVRPLANLVKGVLGENSTMDWMLLHNYYSQMMGRGALFTCEVGPDENFEKNVLIISPSEQLFLRHVSHWSHEDISQYQNFLVEISKALREKQGREGSSRNITTIIEKVLSFRRGIIEQRNNVRRSSRITVMTLSELQMHTRDKMYVKELDWLHVVRLTFNNLLGFKFNESTVVYIRQLNYLNIILKAIDSTSVEVLLHHIHFHFLERFIQHTSVSMNALYYQVLKQPVPERSISCVSSNTMNTIVNYIYVKQFIKEESIATVRDIVSNVRTTLTNQILQTDWIERSTARKATYKLGKIKYAIGYKDWYENEMNMMDYYFRISNNYFGNILDFETMSYRRALQSLWMPVTEVVKKQSPDPSNINAPYNYLTNKIRIPAALLRVPFFGMSFPNAVNYGGLGTIVGHALSRSFDSVGRHYDGKGTAVDWWTNSSLNEYNNRLQSYSNRFRKAFIKECARTSLTCNMDESDYSDEIVTKYMGLVAGYESYRKELRSKAEESREIINLENIVGDKLFFVAYAAMHCETIDAHKMALMGIYTYIPHRLKLNIGLSKMRAFADAFHCKAKDSMNFFGKYE